MLTILAWLIVGAIAGWLASMIMGRGGYGIVGDIIVGLLGAVIAGFLAGVLFGIDVINAPFDFGTLVASIIGAIILIAVVRALTGGRSRV